MSGVVIGLRFLAGRYHATGWDHHVNEGVVEWPPSPWRIMRALVAAAYRLPEAPSREALVGLLNALRGLPVYRVPAASLGHTRHYMPRWKPDDPPGLVFDAFAAVGVGLHDSDAELLVGWPDAQLSPEQIALVERILPAMGSLGRAESWIEARLIHGEPSVMWNANPVEDGASVTHSARVLALQGEREFEQWRRDNEASQAEGARPSAATAPRDLYEIVTQDTPSLHRGAWSGVPGTRWVTYALDGDPFRVRVRPRHATFPEATIARYRIVSRVRPRLIEAVSVGDRLRKALMSQSSEDDGLPLPVFSGKDASGAPLRDQGHAYCLPADDDHDGRIDHVLVWAQCRFDERARSAIERVTRLWGREGFELRLALVAYGAREDYGGVRGNRERGGVPQLGPAHVWESRTPFVLPRHPKRRGGKIVDGPEDQLRRELQCLRLPDPVAIEPIDGTDAGVHTPWHRFMLTRREGGGSRGSAQGYGFRVVFSEPVRGPIAVGYGARQGLGQLEALV